MVIIRPWLYLGKYRETHEPALLQLHGIEAMLQFAGQVAHPGIPFLFIPIEDGVPISPEILKQGINFILAQQQQGKKVLVSCGAAISRSVSFIICALKETENLSLLDAYRMVLKEHPEALPHPVLWKSLCTYYQEETPYFKLLQHYNQRTG